MSTGLSAIAQIEFDAQCKAAYQAMGKLRRGVRVKTGVIGDSHKFRKASRGVATPRIPQTDVTPMGTSYSEVTATLTDWNAPEYTDVFDETRNNIDERTIVAGNIAGAITRREDQLIIDALSAAKGSADIVHGSAGLTDTKMRRIQALMDAAAIPAANRYMAISARGKEDLLSDARFSSRDYVESYVIRTGQLPVIYGFNIFVIEDMDEGGLPKASTTRTNFAWDSQAVGLAIGLDRGTTVDWIAEKTSWLANRLFKAGAIAIDTTGVIEFETTES